MGDFVLQTDTGGTSLFARREYMVIYGLEDKGRSLRTSLSSEKMTQEYTKTGSQRQQSQRQLPPFANWVSLLTTVGQRTI